MLDVHDHRPDDAHEVAAVAAVARACDETGPASASHPAYLPHVASLGRALVAELDGLVVGYAGVLHLPAASAHGQGTAYLTDLFVAPEHRDQGVGSALLDVAWTDGRHRMTSASQDPRALASYARRGAQPRWPLVYLHVPAAADEEGGDADARGVVGTDMGEEVLVAPWQPGDAGWHYAEDGLVTLRVDGAVAVGRPTTYGWRVLRAETPDPAALLLVVAALRPDGAVTLTVPGPHEALPALLARGARITDVDLWCADDGAASRIDPRHALPSPGLS